MINNFSFAPGPQLHFGCGKISVLPAAIKNYGSRILLVTGARSFQRSTIAPELLEQLKENGIEAAHYAIGGEPTPALIDAAVKSFSAYAPDCVVAIGGGSVLDAGKAISAMLPLQEPVKDYLEGVGDKASHPGVKVPLIAIPTTAGTGSEATKNAVISEIGEKGYKRSLRHNNFIPDLAVVDPLLMLSCPPQTTAASGMDAFTQLLESYLSTAANPIADALCVEGLRRVARSLVTAYKDGANVNARTDMALAAYLSGITLANSGLGVVHGFASPIGGYFQIPHGVICSALMGPANTVSVRKLRSTNSNPQALEKYAITGRIFADTTDKPDEYYIDFLLGIIERLTAELNIPKLSYYGLHKDHFEKIIQSTDNKNNPVKLDVNEMTEVLEMATAPS